MIARTIRYGWRLARRHLLSGEELAKQPDLTIGELFALTRLQREAKAVMPRETS